MQSWGAVTALLLLVVAGCDSSSSGNAGPDGGFADGAKGGGGLAGTAGTGGASTSNGGASRGGSPNDAGVGGAVRGDGGLSGDGGGSIDAGHGGSSGSGIFDAGDGAPPVGPDGDVQCRKLDALTAGVCAVAAGTSTDRLIVGTVLTPNRVYHGGEVLVNARGVITCVGCDCGAAARAATTITCPSGVVSPGLINSHDHLQYAANHPHLDTGERYESRNQWRFGLDTHQTITTSGTATPDQLAYGELRFLMGGATSTVAQSSGAGLLRNLDSAKDEGLNQLPVLATSFPLGDGTGIRSTNDCSVFPAAVKDTDIAADDAYVTHVSEGVDAYAENEFRCLSQQNPGHDVVVSKSSFVHGVALRPADYLDMASNGTGLVWSPRSNLSLYGDTARVTEAARAGVLIALGTDWIPTGSMNLLRELSCADSFNRDHLSGFFRDRDLFLMVTANAAAVTAMNDAIGVLAPNKVADIAIFDGSVHASYRAVIEGSPKDVVLVLKAGKPLYGDEAVVTALAAAGCDSFDVCGNTKAACLSSEMGKTYPALLTSLGTGIYPAFSCGAPADEPTCVPSRGMSVNGSSVYDGVDVAGDRDGDGILDAADDCPTVWNPIRPMDSAVQPDADGDGIGDACDPCPLAANATACASYDPDDRDRDGVADERDDCPSVANTTQTDGDGDGLGDACDPCPTRANPGGSGCAATIYDVKNGTMPVGSVVSLTNALVTARAPSGYFLQTKPGDAGYAGPDYSGVFVFDNANTAVVGTRVDIASALVTLFFGEIQLQSPVARALTQTPESPPAPVVVSPSVIATGGTRASALEGVLVEVDGVTVSDANPAPSPSDKAPTNEFAIDSALRVNDFLYLVKPLPAIGTTFTRMVGVLHYRNENSKIEPRSAADLISP